MCYLSRHSRSDREKSIFLDVDIHINDAVEKSMAIQDRLFCRPRSWSLSSLSSLSSIDSDCPCCASADGSPANNPTAVDDTPFVCKILLADTVQARPSASATPPTITVQAQPSTDAVPFAVSVAETQRPSKKRRRRAQKEGEQSHQSKRYKRNPPVRNLSRREHMQNGREKKAAGEAVHAAVSWAELRGSRMENLSNKLYTLEEVELMGLKVVSWDGM
jgi:hypothetical protein